MPKPLSPVVAAHLSPSSFVAGLCALWLAVCCANSHAQVGWREIDSEGMTVVVSYPSAERNRTHLHGDFALQVAKNAAIQPAPRGGAWPLIVMSHGTGGSSEPHHALSTALVQAGFVVAEPLHRGDNWRDTSRAGPESWRTRPQEVSEAINAIAQDPQFKKQVRTERVGVHGMSAGGVSGLALAGGQWQMRALVEHCAENLESDIGFCLNGTAKDAALQNQRRAQFVQAKWLKFSPKALLPQELTLLHGGLSPSGQGPSTDHDPRPDRRIAAVSLLVPVGAIFTAESLARIRIPVGLTVAEKDAVLLPRFHSRHVLAHCSACSVLSEHPLAGHFDWFSPWPADVARSVASQQIRGGLPHPDFSPTERERGYTQIVRFFARHLK